MKIFDRLDTGRLDQSWADRFNPEVSIYNGKEAAFLPAVQAQVSPYGQVATGEMPVYAQLHSALLPYEFTGWLDEMKSITDTCYIGDWSWLEKVRISGPDAVKCLEASSINNIRNMKTGKAKHFVAVNHDGYITVDGIVFRESEDTFLVTGGLTVKAGEGIRTEGMDVTAQTLTSRIYNFHIQGPHSAKVIEKLCGEDISDLGFISFRDIVICGETTRLYRGGMSGELGYEIFGDAAVASVIWKAVVDAGQEFGIRQLGYRTLMSNHLQSFFPTIWVDFIPAIMPPEAHLDMFYRTPHDFGWDNLMDKERDFVGKEAMLKEQAEPTHKTMMLEWNSD
ncbi:MAG: hypothetical protein HUJ76_12540, partial [Parasporobacterium sp.]|nr:hypothetical protein [Parasporobacterium sp.]